MVHEPVWNNGSMLIRVGETCFLADCSHGSKRFERLLRLEYEKRQSETIRDNFKSISWPCYIASRWNILSQIVSIVVKTNCHSGCGRVQGPPMQRHWKTVWIIGKADIFKIFLIRLTRNVWKKDTHTNQHRPKIIRKIPTTTLRTCSEEPQISVRHSVLVFRSGQWKIEN